MDMLAAFRWVSMPNILTDLGILVLPLPHLWDLNTSVGQKIGLTFVFVVGSLSIPPHGFNGRHLSEE